MPWREHWGIRKMNWSSNDASIAANTRVPCELVHTRLISTPTSAVARAPVLQERMASIAWAIKIATLTAMTMTTSQLITFVSILAME